MFGDVEWKALYYENFPCSASEKQSWEVDASVKNVTMLRTSKLSAYCIFL